MDQGGDAAPARGMHLSAGKREPASSSPAFPPFSLSSRTLARLVCIWTSTAERKIIMGRGPGQPTKQQGGVRPRGTCKEGRAGETERERQTADGHDHWRARFKPRLDGAFPGPVLALGHAGEGPRSGPLGQQGCAVCACACACVPCQVPGQAVGCTGFHCGAANRRADVPGGH